MECKIVQVHIYGEKILDVLVCVAVSSELFELLILKLGWICFCIILCNVKSWCVPPGYLSPPLEGGKPFFQCSLWSLQKNLWLFWGALWHEMWMVWHPGMLPCCVYLSEPCVCIYIYAHAYLNTLCKYTLFVHFRNVLYIHFINTLHLYKHMSLS